jgi:hypothetical protein
MDSMSDTSDQQVTPAPMPDPEADPAAFMAWATSPAGQDHFRRLNMALMEERVNAEQQGRAVPSVVAVKPSEQSGT